MQDAVRSIRAVYALLLILLTVCGCTSMHESEELSNPPRIHGPLPQGPELNAHITEPADVAKRQYENYYRAFQTFQTACDRVEHAQTPGAPSCREHHQYYFEQGIGLVDSYCRVWFRQMDDHSRRLALKRTDHGVLSQLGTALIGIAKLHSDVTAVYGALTTAYTGSLSGAESLLLIAPETKTIETQVFAHLSQRAVELRATQFVSVPQSQGAVEDYARICTWKHAKSIVEKSVDRARTQVSADGAVEILAFSENDESRTLRTLWKPGGVTDAAVEKALRDWLSKSGLDISISELIYAEQYAPLRGAAVVEAVKAMGEIE
ncbi:hypothetical protein ACW5EG_07320 [Luteimonas sp. A611]